MVEESGDLTTGTGAVPPEVLNSYEILKRNFERAGLTPPLIGDFAREAMAKGRQAATRQAYLQGGWYDRFPSRGGRGAREKRERRLGEAYFGRGRRVDVDRVVAELKKTGLENPTQADIAKVLGAKQGYWVKEGVLYTDIGAVQRATEPDIQKELTEKGIEATPEQVSAIARGKPYWTIAGKIYFDKEEAKAAGKAERIAYVAGLSEEELEKQGLARYEVGPRTFKTRREAEAYLKTLSEAELKQLGLAEYRLPSIKIARDAVVVGDKTFSIRAEAEKYLSSLSNKELERLGLAEYKIGVKTFKSEKEAKTYIATLSERDRERLGLLDYDALFKAGREFAIASKIAKGKAEEKALFEMGRVAGMSEAELERQGLITYPVGSREFKTRKEAELYIAHLPKQEQERLGLVTYQVGGRNYKTQKEAERAIAEASFEALPRLEKYPQEFQERVKQLQLDRPHLTIWQAEGIARVEWQIAGKPLPEAGTLIQRVQGAVASLKAQSPQEREAWEAEVKALPGEAGKLALGFIPVLGTTVWWNKMSRGERAFSIALDVLIVLPLLKGGLRGALALPSEKAIQQLKLDGRALAKALKPADPQLAKSLGKVTDAQVDFIKAGEQAEYIRNLSKYYPNKLRLERAEKALELAGEKLEARATELVKQNKIHADDPLVAESFKRLPKEIVANTRNLVETYSKRGLNLEKYRLDFEKTKTELSAAKAKFPTDPSKWGDLATESFRAEAKYKAALISKGRDLGKLTGEWLKAKQDLRAAQRLGGSREQITLLGLKATKLEGQVRESLKGLEIEFRPGGALSRGGKTLLRPGIEELSPALLQAFRKAGRKGLAIKGAGVGGGVRLLSTSEGILIEARGISLVPGLEEEINSRPIISPKTQPVIQPNIQPKISPRPLVQPGIQPSIQPSTQPSIQPGIKPSIQPKIRPSIRPGIKPSIKPEIKPSIRPEIKPGVKPGIKLGVRPEVRPQVKPEIKPEVKPQVTAKVKIQTKPSPRVSSRVSPRVTPKIIPPPRKRKAEQLADKLPAGTVGWKQGLFYKVVPPPYKEEDVIYTLTPPPGIPILKGKESPQRSLRKVRKGTIPDVIVLPQGIVMAKIRKGKTLTFQRRRRR